jgi:type I restriction enzyme S subunit
MHWKELKNNLNTEDLKNKILQLAVQGKLVEHDPNDEPASVLLKKIQKEKERIVKEKKSRKSKPLPPITEDEIPFEIPEGWEWVRLGESALVIMGQSPSSKTYNEENNGLPFYQGKSNFGVMYPIPTKWCSNPKKIAIKGDILISVRAPVGPTNLANEDCCIGRGLSAIRPLCETKSSYFLYAIRALEKTLADNAVGSTFVAIKLDDLNNLLIPLPPLSEQKRIIEKVDELFAIIEHLDSNKDDLLETINNTRNKILQSAVQGKLAPQDPTDEPTSKLLEKIKEEKERLIKEKKIKKSKPLPPITEDEIPFELPDGWEWVRLGNLLLKLTDGTHKTPPYTASGVPFISVKDISNGKIDFSDTKFISQKTHEKLFKRCNPEFGDLLLTKVGTTGIPVRVDTDIEFSLFVSVALLKFNNQFISNRYLMHLINSPFIKEKSEENTRGVGNKNLVLRDIANFAIPLPPLNEQKRIAEKVDILIALCDELEEQIIESRKGTVYHPTFGEYCR